MNTADDPNTIESIVLPGRDGVIGTTDDKTVVLSGFTREIKIRDIAGESGQLRSIVVTIKYPSGSGTQTYTLTTYISAYA
ncbi:MAG: hypothetical protein QM736_23760 [Vicinamibacterales bacterium]